MLVSCFPLANQLLGLATKDYSLWYQMGWAVRQGLDIYPRPESRRLFPFMYPPSAAAMLGLVSVLGPTGMLLAAVLVDLGVVAGLIGPPSGCASRSRHGQAPAGRDCAVARGHRLDS